VVGIRRKTKEGIILGEAQNDKNVIRASEGCNQRGSIFITTDEEMPQTNILIVEDDLTTQEMARMVLENAGYGVSVARSAEDAERAVRNLWPDIVLMDRDLPGMDGLELTRRLKVAEETAGITVIAFSSMHSTEDNEKALAAGSDGFVHKPFTVRGLLQTIAWHASARENRYASSNTMSDDAVRRPTAESNGKAGVTNNAFGGLFMSLSRTAIVSGLLIIAAAASGGAQTATQTVTFQVDAINQVAVTGTPTLDINAAVAGGAPTTVTSSGNTWAVTTNQTTAKITASIASNMPAGLTLSATLGAPAGATSAGIKSLSTVAVDIVTGITKLNATGLALTYQLDATAAAGVVTSATRVVTYTITGGV
jgi:DNA-binding response OmpR family regulator